MYCTDQIKFNLSFGAISFFSTVENQIASSHKALLAMTINSDTKLDPPEEAVPEPVFNHASPRPGSPGPRPPGRLATGLGPSKKDGLLAMQHVGREQPAEQQPFAIFRSTGVSRIYD